MKDFRRVISAILASAIMVSVIGLAGVNSIATQYWVDEYGNVWQLNDDGSKTYVGKEDEVDLEELEGGIAESTDKEGTEETVEPDTENAEDKESEETEEFVPDTKGLGGFITRLYSLVLSRNPEEVGYKDWYKKLASGEFTGKQLADGFLDSPEFLGKGLSDGEYVEVLYNVFFDRESDEAGFNDWVSKLESGMSRYEIREGFYNSTEWANTCLIYGIKSGGTGVPDIKPEPTEGMVNFVNALYKECLGRKADEVGLTSWTDKLVAQEVTGKEVAYGFFFSQEFTTLAAKMTPEELITVFYTVFLDRKPDKAGMEDWKSRISWGDAIGVLFSGFADSQEFSSKCNTYGIIPGDHIDVPEVSIDSSFMAFAEEWDIKRGIERLDTVENLLSHTFYNEYNVRGDETTSEVHYISDKDLEVIEEFAAKHFAPGWTAGQKAAYTIWWIHYNVTYAQGDLWSAISGCGPAEAIFVRKVGQCAQYNGALCEMLCWLGFDAYMINGTRRSNSGGTWSHYWCEVKIGETIYVMEAGNEGHDGPWYYFCALYSETKKFVKNGVVQG